MGATEHLSLPSAPSLSKCHLNLALFFDESWVIKGLLSKTPG
jgi:hypothetical protein